MTKKQAQVGNSLLIELFDGTRLTAKVIAVRPAKGDGYLVDYSTKSGLVRTFNPVLTNLAHMFF